MQNKPNFQDVQMNVSIFSQMAYENNSNWAGIERFGPHAIRHFFATRLMRQGVPLAKISKILGHASIKTTEQIYIHWLPKDVLGLTDCLSD